MTLEQHFAYQGQDLKNQCNYSYPDQVNIKSVKTVPRNGTINDYLKMLDDGPATIAY